MIYWDLFVTFFKVGLFSFGGGYAMIPLISSEIQRHGWLLESEFVQIIGIAEMTPGPIAVNAATFVGYKMGGVGGSAVATLGVALPSLLIVLFISSFFFKHSQNIIMKKVFYGIRPVIAGLIFAAALSIGKSALFINHTPDMSQVNYITFVIGIVVLILALKTKIHPILLIIGSGILGFMTIFL
ncbi:MAG: chromate transporter [Firmicutes bacterium HGW-Firmicutes-2]|jgi:chromate transporter|nr:MAG: chromate transporter [Firmicutes bacterium HGW-Firmicutes-2]